MFWILRGTGAQKVGTLIGYLSDASHHPIPRPECILSPHLLVAMKLQQSLRMGTTQDFLAFLFLTPHALFSPGNS